MSRVKGTPNTGIRFNRDTGEFLARCMDCRARGVEAFWPLTLEFWEPGKGMARCRSCHNRRRNQLEAERRRSDPAHRARVLEANREMRRQMGRIWYAQRWERLKADPEAHADYLIRRREQRRRASAAYRARQKERAA